MSVDNYIEKLDSLLDAIKEKNKKYQNENYPEILKEKKLRDELNSFVSNGPKTCREFKDLSYKFKKDEQKKKDPNLVNKETSTEIDNFDEFLDNEVATMYNKPWNKLDKLMKKNKLFEFIDFLKTDNNLDEKEKCNLHNLIMKEYENGYLNKKNEVNYDKDNGKIDSLHNLIISKEDNTVSFRFKEKKILKKKEPAYKTKSELDKVITATKTLLKNN